MNETNLRKPAVAGQFYPDEPETLRCVTRQYIEDAKVEPAPENVTAIVSPHAGYVYSGPTAGHAFARILGKRPGRVVLLGCSHRFHIGTASVCTSGSFETPVGIFPIDEPFAERLARMTQSTSAEPHWLEHSLEVQLPFLASAVGVVPIVPVLFGGPVSDWHAEIGKQLAAMLDPEDLVIASTDLSHYLSEQEANAIDTRSIETVLSKDWNAFADSIENQTCSMCGASAVTAAMACALARESDAWQVLDYRTSGAASGDFSRVVGYAALSMERAA
jgi:hypothetical protein